MEAETTLANITAVQTALTVIQTLALTEYMFPPTCTPTDDSSYDFIIIGGGTAGCVLASRLTENSNVTVLLLEAGGYPPLESILPSLFTILPESVYDYNFTSVNDNYSGQNLQGSTVSLTQGKVVGGSGAVQHMMYEQPNENDLQEWVDISGDESWSYSNMLPYFLKMETLTDEEILNSSSAQYHGTTGPVKIARQSSPKNVDILAAFAELGHTTKLDLSGEVSLGYGEPLFSIADDVRQSNALAYLGPAKDRPNLCVSLYSTATKLLISNKAAYGVQIIDANGDTLEIKAAKEVIVSAGAINSPKLLQLSGIGPADVLNDLSIEMVADSPVGENLIDNHIATIFYKMEADTKTTPASNPHIFPVPAIIGFVALDPTQTIPDYQSVNLLFPHDSTEQIHLCGKVFKYKPEICQKAYDASRGRVTLVAMPYLLKPKSRGRVVAASTDPADPPTIYTGVYSNSSDLTLMGKSLLNYHEIINSTYFKSINASLVDLGVCSGDTSTTEFWECYALAMSATTWHYCGTAAMGSVLDSTLKVKGVDGLRVVGSPSMPTITSGKTNTAVTMLTEKAADIIKAAWGLD